MTKKKQRTGWIFVSPFIVGQLIFMIIPLICAVYFAFSDYDYFTSPEWVGLENFKFWLFESRGMWSALRNTFVYALIDVPLGIAVACVIAYLLNTKIKGIGFFRTIFYMPVLTPLLAVSLIWLLMYNPQSGYLNELFGHVGIGPFKYVFSSSWLESIVSIIAMNTWKGVGYTSIYILTAMQSISVDVMEAAEVDGAVGFKKFFKITLPLITPTIFFLMIIGFSGAMQVFDSFFLMAEYSSADINVLNTLMYREAWVNMDVGKAAAISWISFIIILSITLVQKYSEKRWVHYEE